MFSLKFIFTHLFKMITIFLLLLSSCNHKKVFTPQIAMDSLATKKPVDGAIFYAKMRSSYNFMDQLYTDSIVPVLASCNYYDLKQITNILKGTPNEDFVTLLFQTSKEQLSQNVYKEIKKNSQHEILILKNVILPSIKMDVDSSLEADVKDVFSKYAGGFLNYRKINFLLGRNQKDFKNMFWKRIDTAEYRMRINRHLQAYLDTIALYQSSYCKYLTGKTIDTRSHISQPQLTIGLSKSTMCHIKKYTTGQTDEILAEGFKDYVAPLAIGAFTGGGSLILKLYDTSNDIYDVVVTINDIKEAKVDPDDMVIYVCTHDLSYQIENYYLNKCTDLAIRAITNSNVKLYNYIIKNL